MNKWPVMTILMVFCIGLTACQTGTSVSKKQTYPPTYAEASNLYDALEALSVKLIDSTKTSIQGKRISKIAVADFIGPGDRTTGLGEYISDKVSVQLLPQNNFRILWKDGNLNRSCRPIKMSLAVILTRIR